MDYYTGLPTEDQTKKPVKPQGNITRAEVATIYFRMLTDESRNHFWSQDSGYPDVALADWFNNAIATLSNGGIISGYPDGTFDPNGYITRAEFAVIAARFFDMDYQGRTSSRTSTVTGPRITSTRPRKTALSRGTRTGPSGRTSTSPGPRR